MTSETGELQRLVRRAVDLQECTDKLHVSLTLLKVRYVT
jgi:hypothetical protein